MFLAVSIVLLTAIPVGADSEDSSVRFVHAVPGVGEATLSVGGQEIGGAGFGGATDQATVAAGPTTLDLSAPDGVELSADQDLKPGRSYLAVALTTDDGGELRIFRDRGAKADLARLRMIHAAPELGQADFAIDGEVIAKAAAYTDATDYIELQPGEYQVDIESPKTGETVLVDTIPLASGTSDTALVVGTQGEQARVILVEDDVAAPGGAPETGLGGLAPEQNGSDWTLAIVAALAAGGVGVLVARRRAAGSARQA